LFHIWRLCWATLASTRPAIFSPGSSAKAIARTAPLALHSLAQTRFNVVRQAGLLPQNCRTIAGGREPRKGVLVNAGEIETAVLSAVGLESTGLSPREEHAALREAIRRVVFSADTGRIKIEFQPDASPAEDLDGQVSGRV